MNNIVWNCCIYTTSKKVFWAQILKYTLLQRFFHHPDSVELQHPDSVELQTGMINVLDIMPFIIIVFHEQGPHVLSYLMVVSKFPRYEVVLFSIQAVLSFPHFVVHIPRDSWCNYDFLGMYKINASGYCSISWTLIWVSVHGSTLNPFETRLVFRALTDSSLWKIPSPTLDSLEFSLVNSNTTLDCYFKILVYSNTNVHNV